MAEALDNCQSLARPSVSNLHSRCRFHENSTIFFARYLLATARNRAISDALGFRADPPFICTKMKSKRSPDFRSLCIETVVSFRIAKISTMPRHSPPPEPRNETNLHRCAARAERALKSISVYRSVFAAFSYAV